jgi:hypothetical protein
MADLVAVPEWTQVRQKGGLDPLGLQAPSIRLYQALVPGISNVTLRTRYYGFYPWLSEEYPLIALPRNDGLRTRSRSMARLTGLEPPPGAVGCISGDIGPLGWTVDSGGPGGAGHSAGGGQEASRPKYGGSTTKPKGATKMNVGGPVGARVPGNGSQYASAKAASGDRRFWRDPPALVPASRS